MKEIEITLRIKVNEDSMHHATNYVKNAVEDVLMELANDFVVEDFEMVSDDD